MMHFLAELTARQPIVPFIRESDFAVRKPWHVPARRLLDYLLIYVQEGHCLIHADGRDYHFRGGEFCLLQPNTVHTLRGMTNTITPFAHLDIFYNPERDKSFPTRAGQIDLSDYRHLMQPRLNDIHGIEVPVKFTPKQPIKFRDTLLAMVQSWQRRDPVSQYAAQVLASELVLMLLQDHTKEQAQPSSAPQFMNWITSYFSFRLAEPLSVADMARRANLSPSRFSAVFKRHFGMPPHQYLLRLRVKHAQELLRTTGLTLQEIAGYCGFADVHHFSKSFKKIAGQSPGEYRQAAREAYPPGAESHVQG